MSGEPERRHSTDDDNIHGARGRGKINPSYPGEFPPPPSLIAPRALLQPPHSSSFALHNLHRVRECEQQQQQHLHYGWIRCRSETSRTSW